MEENQVSELKKERTNWEEDFPSMEDQTFFFRKLLKAAIPKKSEWIDSFFLENKLRVLVEANSKDLGFQVFPEKGIILVGAKALDRIWMLGRVFCELYEQFRNQILQDSKRKDFRFDNQRSKDLILGLEELLNNPDGWSIHSLFQNGYFSNNDQSKTGWKNCSDELLLMVLTCIILHEMGHIALNHRKGNGRSGKPGEILSRNAASETFSPDVEANFRMEFEADEWAARILLEGLPPENSLFLKRCIGLVVSFLTLLHVEFQWGPNGSLEHPPCWVRLYSQLNLYLGQSNDQRIWLFICFLLYIHMIFWKNTPERSLHKTPKEWAEFRVRKHIPILARVL